MELRFDSESAVAHVFIEAPSFDDLISSTKVTHVLSTVEFDFRVHGMHVDRGELSKSFNKGLDSSVPVVVLWVERTRSGTV